MASVKKHGKGWQARIRHKFLKGGSKSKTFSKKSLAEKWAREVELEIEQGTFVDTKSASTTLMADMLDQYAKEIGSKKAAKTQKEEGYVINALKKHVGQASVLECDSEFWFGYGKLRREVHKVSADTVIKHLQLVHATFSACMTLWKLPLKSNPVADARKMLSMAKLLDGANKQHMRRLSKKEYTKLDEYRPKRFGLGRWGVLFAIETFMRRSEITTMDWSRIDWENCVYHLEKEKNDHHKRIVGQGRTVPLSPKAISILKEIEKFKQDGKAEYGEYVWPWRDPKSLTQAFDRICERVGIDKSSIRFHDTRHDGISREVDKNTDPRILGASAGHMDMRSMARYSHPDLITFAKERNSANSV